MEQLMALPLRRAADDRRALEGAGVTGPALELALAAGAPARHQSRVAQVLRLAREYGWDVTSHVGAMCMATDLLITIVGAGGPGDLGGPNGRSRRAGRIGPLCGSGRSRSRDGAAWDAAIGAAWNVLHAEHGMADWTILTVVQHGPEWALRGCLAEFRTTSPDREATAAARRLLGRALKAIGRDGCGTGEVAVRVNEDPELIIRASAADIADAYNRFVGKEGKE